MRHWIVCALLSAAVVVPSALAQKDKGKEPPKGGPFVEISKGKDDKFRFFVRIGAAGEKGRLLAMSGTYASEKEASKGFDTLKTALSTAKVAKPKDKPKGAYIEVNQGKDDKFRYVVRDGEGKMIAQSGVIAYASEKEALKAIEELKLAANKATRKPITSKD